MDSEGNAKGFHTATGTSSIHVEHFTESGESLPAAIFESAIPEAGEASS